MKRLMFLAGTMMFAILAAFMVRFVLVQDRRVDEIDALREGLDRTRAAADSCGLAIARQQERFLHFNAVVDSLRAQVKGFEDSDLGGVPQAQYPEYLELWQLYNDSVDVWQDRVDSLQRSEARCRALIEAHNQLGDSIQKRREELGGGRG